MNVWSLFSLIPGLAHLFLGMYALLRSPGRKINQTFALYSFALFLWCISEFFHRSASNERSAFIWTRIGGPGWCFMPSLSLYFMLAFSEKLDRSPKKIAYPLLFLPPSIILLLFLTTDIIYSMEPVKVFFGYTLLPGRYLWLYTLYYSFAYLAALLLLVSVISNGTSLQKRQATTILIGSTLFALSGTATNIMFPTNKILVTEFATTYSLLWASSIFYAVFRYKMFDIIPSAEIISSTPPKYNLDRSNNYLVEEEIPDKAYDVFHDQVTHGLIGLCLTKLIPQKVRERYKIPNTSMIHISFNSQDNSIPPTEIDRLIMIISDFTKISKGFVIIVDCLDQIKFANGFERTVSFLRDLSLLCKESGSFTILSIPPRMFEREELEYLLKNFRRLNEL